MDYSLHDTMNIVPHGVQHGLLLEDRKVMLPWGARLIHLLRSSHPDHVLGSAAWTEFFWNKPVLLNGIHALYLQVVLFPYGWMNCGVVCLYKSEERARLLPYFEQAQAALTQQFGEPTRRCTDEGCFKNEYVLRWQAAQHVALTLQTHRESDTSHTLHSCVLNISHQTAEGLPASLEEKRTGWDCTNSTSPASSLARQR